MSKEKEPGFLEKVAKTVEVSGIVIAILGLIRAATDIFLGGAAVAVGADIFRRNRAKKRQESH